jgi:hypothetical protein
MGELNIRGEVNIRTVPFGFKGNPNRVALSCLVVDGRPVPLDAFRRVPCEPLEGEPLGWVNYHWDEDGEWVNGGPLHVVWLNCDGELRRTRVPAESPADVDPGEWAQRYAELATLPQLYIDG